MAKNGLKKIFNQAEKFAFNMNRALFDFQRSENMMRYGKMAAEMIKLRTRLGSGVSQAGAQKGKLKPLADSTKDARKKLREEGELNENTTPGNSNLTRTGQLLDSLTASDPSNGSVLVGPQGARRDGKTNDEVASFVTEAGRPFNNLSKIEIKRLNDTLKRELKGLIKKQLTKNK